MPYPLLFALAVVFLGVIGTALGLRSSRWLLTVFGLMIWWFGTVIMVVTLDVIAIGATLEILAEPVFDLQITPAREIPPPIKVDKEA